MGGFPIGKFSPILRIEKGSVIECDNYFVLGHVLHLWEVIPNDSIGREYINISILESHSKNSDCDNPYIFVPPHSGLIPSLVVVVVIVVKIKFHL